MAEKQVERDPETGQLKKGSVLNPDGRPKGSVSLVRIIKNKLQEEFPEDASIEEKKTYADKVVETYINKAIDESDTKLLRDLIDRIDGKPVQTNKIEGELKTNELDKRNKILENAYDKIIKEGQGTDSGSGE